MKQKPGSSVVVNDTEEVTYVVAEQQVVDDGTVRQGKVVVAKKGRIELGKTGYVEWNTGAYENTSVNTAALQVSDSVWELRVNRPYRQQAIGSRMVDKLFSELKQEGYDQLIISFAVGSAKGFYDKILKRFKASGKIAAFTVMQREHSAMGAYDYDIRF